jgi:hypothetical protein
MINSAAKSRAINGGERLSGSSEKHSDGGGGGFISINTPLVCALITHSGGRCRCY